MQIGGVSCDHPEHQVGMAKVVALADVTAFGVYMGLWFPDVERWVWILAVVFFITAGEAQNPKKVLPRAINSVPVRILLFYVLALAVIMSIQPWNTIDGQTSPFVSIFQNLGLEGAALVTFAVITVWLMTLSSHARMKRESGTVPFRVSGRDRFVVTKIYYVGNCWGIGGDMRNFAGCASGVLALGARRRCGANP